MTGKLRVRPLVTGQQDVDRFSRDVIEQLRGLLADGGAGTVGPAGPAGPAGAAGASGGGWLTPVDIDFTVQANANLITGGDGNKTIGGLTFPISGTANASTYEVLNGTGIHIAPTGGVSKVVTFQANWLDVMPAFATFSGLLEYEISWQLAHPIGAMSVNGENSYTSLYDKTAGLDRVLAGFVNTGGVNQNWFKAVEGPGAGTTVVATNSTSGTTDDAWTHRIRSGLQAECYSGLYSGGWPAGTRYRGHHTVVQPVGTTSLAADQWIAPGNATTVYYAYVSGTGATTARTIVIKRLRIRVRGL